MGKTYNILCFGDSLTYGYNGMWGSGTPRPYSINLLKELNDYFTASGSGKVDLKFSFQVETCGLSGDTTDNMIGRLDRELKRQYLGAIYDLVIIIGGTNDLFKRFGEGDGVEVSNNIGEMVNVVLRHNKDAKIVLCPIPPTRYDRSKKLGSSLLHFVECVKKNQLSLVQMHPQNISFCDLRTKIPYYRPKVKGDDESDESDGDVSDGDDKDKADKNDYWCDSVHYSPAGYNKLGAILAEHIVANNLIN